MADSRYKTGKTHALRFFSMRVNVDWDEFRDYLNQANGSAVFYLVYHDDPFPDDEEFDLMMWAYSSCNFHETDFIKSDEGYPEVQLQIEVAMSGQQLDQSLFSLVYARGDSLLCRWVFRNCKLSELGALWDQVEKTAKEQDVDPRLNNFGLYQITQAFGKKPAIPTLYAWLLPHAPVYFDCHMHIQSNHCAPLPLVWEKIPLQPNLSWGGIDFLDKLIFPETGRIGAMSTKQIGLEALGQLKNAMREEIIPYNYRRTEMPKVITPLPMDMDYGHFRGYAGEPIYVLKDGIFYYHPSPFSNETKSIAKEDGPKYEDYRHQLLYHLEMIKAKESQWKMLSYYHYDPRRWNDAVHWQDPLKEIVSDKQAGNNPFIGVKMYTSLGYRPWDPKLPHQEKLYAYCEQFEIPIMNHCTSQGMYTHEKVFYYDLLKRDKGFETDATIEDLQQSYDAWYESLFAFGPNPYGAALEDCKNRWFENHYVHPKAWEPVAKKFPKLKVCLAHFMGNERWGNKQAKSGQEYNGAVYGFTADKSSGQIDRAKTSDWITGLLDLIREDNSFHSDISFFVVDKYSEDSFIEFLKWVKKSRKWLLDRILWGTDWPLLEIGTDLKAPLWDTFTNNLIERLNYVDKGLWFRFSLVNPARFLNIKSLAKNLSSVYGGESIPNWVNQLPGSLDEFLALRKKKVS